MEARYATAKHRSDRKAVSHTIVLFDCFLALQQYPQNNAFKFHCMCIDLSCREGRTKGGVPGPCPRTSSCEHTHTHRHKHRALHKHIIHGNTHVLQRIHIHMVCESKECVNTYLHPHTLQIYPCSCGHTILRQNMKWACVITWQTS